MSVAAAKSDISDFELLARLIFHPSQRKKNKFVKKLMYPRPHEDEERKGYFTNKISMVRVCMGNHDGSPTWKVHVDIANNLKTENQTFQGFLLQRAYYFRELDFGLEPAPTEDNPYHMHLVIKEYNEPYQQDKQGFIAEYLTPQRRKMLDDLKDQLCFVEFKEGQAVKEEESTQCELCSRSELREQ